MRQGRSQGPARPGCVGRLASPAAARGLRGADSVTGGSAGLGRGVVLGVEGQGAAGWSREWPGLEMCPALLWGNPWRGGHWAHVGTS